MIYKQKPINKIVQEMKNMGELLLPYNYPKKPFSYEEYINVLKTKEIVVDGHFLILNYTKSDYDSYFLETLQLFSRTHPFVPFELVVNVAVKFLGKDNIFLVELFSDGRKIYCWLKATKNDGSAIDCPSAMGSTVTECEFNGFKYNYIINPGINFH